MSLEQSMVFVVLFTPAIVWFVYEAWVQCPWRDGNE
jgi:hypothetical protein